MSVPLLGCCDTFSSSCNTCLQDNIDWLKIDLQKSIGTMFQQVFPLFPISYRIALILIVNHINLLFDSVCEKIFSCRLGRNVYHSLVNVTKSCQDGMILFTARHYFGIVCGMKMVVPLVDGITNQKESQVSL